MNLQPGTLPLRLLLAPLLLLVVPASAQSRPKFVPPDSQPLTAEQTADTIGALGALQRLQTLSAQPSGFARPAIAANALELLTLNQQLLVRVTAASLQLDATMGEIDAEIAETRELQSFLSAQRQRTVDLLNLASLGIGGTVGSASAALGLTSHGQAAGVLGVISGAATTALSVVTLGVGGGHRSELAVPSNMLAHLFDLPSEPNNLYPPAVARFMDIPAPNDPDRLSRQDRLIREWVAVGRLPPPDTPAGRGKMARLASRPGQGIELSIGDLDDRQNMLYDFRARLSFMKRDLANLLDSLASAAATASEVNP